MPVSSNLRVHASSDGTDYYYCATHTLQQYPRPIQHEDHLHLSGEAPQDPDEFSEQSLRHPWFIQFNQFNQFNLTIATHGFQHMLPQAASYHQFLSPPYVDPLITMSTSTSCTNPLQPRRPGMQTSRRFGDPNNSIITVSKIDP